MGDAFRRVAGGITKAVGSPWALLLAIGVVIAWAASGPVFRFSDTWQLAINTGTTVVTFLMVFVIQASQNREARATQLKLDELIRSTAHARNELIDLENAPDQIVELHQEHFRAIVEAAQRADPDVMDDIEVRRGARRRAGGQDSRAASAAAEATAPPDPAAAVNPVTRQAPGGAWRL